MGEELDLSNLEGESVGSKSGNLQIVVVAPGTLDRVDVIRSGQVHFSVPCDGRRECSFTRRLENLETGEYVYARAVQTDGGAAWSSPYYLR